MAQTAIDLSRITTDESPEAILANSRPFGDPSYLDECTWTRYTSRLSMLKEHLPSSEPVLAALKTAGRQSKYRIIGDSTVRSAINRALAHFKLDSHDSAEQTGEILEIAARQLANHSILPPLQLSVNDPQRLGPKPYHGWIWTGDTQDGACTRLFGELVKANLGPAGLSLKPAGAQAIHTLRRAAKLLDLLLPQLAASALDHVQMVALIDHTKPFLSVTNPNIPGVIFLSETVLTSPWKAAEYLLHEALHAKFLDTEHTHSLLRQGYQPADCAVRPPWRRPHSADPYLWPMNRILTVPHVYAALALLFQVIREKSPELVQEYGPVHEKNLEFTIRQSLDRAEYLVYQLHLNQAQLGKAGVYFADWLSSVLKLLDHNPRPEGSYFHLLADLYEREANVLGKLIAGASREQLHSVLSGTRWFEGTTPANVFEEMLAQEVAAVEQIASECEEPLFWLEAVKFRDEGGYSATAELAQRLWGVRALLCQVLNRVPSGRYTAAETPALLDILLIGSSRHVETLLKSLRSSA